MCLMKVREKVYVMKCSVGFMDRETGKIKEVSELEEEYYGETPEELEMRWKDWNTGEDAGIHAYYGDDVPAYFIGHSISARPKWVEFYV